MPRRRPGRTFAVRAALYYLLCWSVIGFVVPATTACQWLVLALAVSTTAPLVAFIVRGGWRAYPTAAFRVLVIRPILYTQLLLPLVAGGALLGLAVGTVIGHSVDGGPAGAPSTSGDRAGPLIHAVADHRPYRQSEQRTARHQRQIAAACRGSAGSPSTRNAAVGYARHPPRTMNATSGAVVADRECEHQPLACCRGRNQRIRSLTSRAGSTARREPQRFAQAGGAASGYASPSAGAIPRMARMTNAMCSSRSTPSSRPGYIPRGSRRAQMPCPSFLYRSRVEVVHAPRRPHERAAVISPVSSSTANSVFAIMVSRGTPV